MEIVPLSHRQRNCIPFAANAKAALWYERAAKQGHVEAQRELGGLLAQGEIGVLRDFEKATFWLRKAAEQGDTKARRRLGDLAARRSSGTRAGTTESEAYASAAAIVHFFTEIAFRSEQCMKAFPKKAEAYNEAGNKYVTKNEEPIGLANGIVTAILMGSQRGGTRMGGFTIGGRESGREKAIRARAKAMRQSILHEREKEPGVFKAKCAKSMKDLADGSLDIERRMPDHLGVVRVAAKQLEEWLELRNKRFKRERERWKRERERRFLELFPQTR